jgi:hypothetical protein
LAEKPVLASIVRDARGTFRLKRDAVVSLLVAVVEATLR